MKQAIGLVLAIFWGTACGGMPEEPQTIGEHTQAIKQQTQKTGEPAQEIEGRTQAIKQQAKETGESALTDSAHSTFASEPCTATDAETGESHDGTMEGNFCCFNSGSDRSCWYCPGATIDCTSPRVGFGGGAIPPAEILGL